MIFQSLFLIKKLEGCSSKVKNKNILLNETDIKNNITVYPYLCIAKYKTIGFGIRVNDSKFDNGISVLECEILLQKKILEFEKYLNSWLKVNTSQNQFDALICLCYNRPIWAKIIINLINNNSEIELINKTWLSFATINNKFSQSIFKRRFEELSLFNLIENN